MASRLPTYQTQELFEKGGGFSAQTRQANDDGTRNENQICKRKRRDEQQNVDY